MTVRPVELALLLLLATLWGASFTFIKVGVETIPPVTFIAGRTAIAALVLLAVMGQVSAFVGQPRLSVRRTVLVR